jgi:uncharacterized DUF497 family protein
MRKDIMHFEWDVAKERQNVAKHGISFKDAMTAFNDPRRVIRPDLAHSLTEKRLFCFGRVGDEIMTVRFTMRGTTIRIIGAAYWRKGKGYYEQKDTL